MKNLLICSLLSLLASCSLFHTTPPSVVNGQRAVYQGIALMKENTDKIIDRYVADTKAAVTYHLHFVCEKEILALDDEDYEGYTDTWTETRRERLRKQRDDKIKSSFADIDKIAEGMRTRVSENNEIIRKLVGSVYNYLSTTPIGIDNIGFLIEKLDAVTKR